MAVTPWCARCRPSSMSCFSASGMTTQSPKYTRLLRSLRCNLAFQNPHVDIGSSDLVSEKVVRIHFTNNCKVSSLAVSFCICAVEIQVFFHSVSKFIPAGLRDRASGPALLLLALYHTSWMSQPVSSSRKRVRHVFSAFSAPFISSISGLWSVQPPKVNGWPLAKFNNISGIYSHSQRITYKEVN